MAMELPGPGGMAGPMTEVRTMTAQSNKNITSFLGPFSVVGTVFGTWAILAFMESCLPPWADPHMDCDHHVLFFVFIAGGVVMLAGVMAWVTRVIYHPVTPFPTRTSELPSALLTGFVMAVGSYGLIRWEWYFPNIAGQFSGWLGVGLLVFGIVMILVNYLSRGRREP